MTGLRRGGPGCDPADVDTVDVSEILGRSSPAITMQVYQYTGEERLNEPVRQVGDTIFGGSGWAAGRIWARSDVPWVGLGIDIWCRRGDLNPYAPQRALGPQPDSRHPSPSPSCAFVLVSRLPRARMCQRVSLRHGWFVRPQVRRVDQEEAFGGCWLPRSDGGPMSASPLWQR
jgi:hypothetical protein